MPARSLACLVLLTLVAGMPAGAEISKDWIRVESGNFVGMGNASESDLRETIAQLEAFRSGIGRLLPGLAAPSGTVTTLILFKSPAAFVEFGPRDEKNRPRQGVGGFFTRTIRGDRFVMGTGRDESTLRTAYHEYVHALVHRRLVDVPSWVDEGVADLYSTFKADPKKGTVTIGIVPPARAQSLRPTFWIPLKDVVAPDAATQLWTKHPEQVPLWYAESWAFVHFLAFSSTGARGPQLATYLNALQANKTPDAAFVEAFGAPYAQIDRELREYLRAPLPAVRLALDPPAVQSAATLAVRRMSVAEAQAAQGCLLSDNGALEAAERHLAAALADDATNVEARACLGGVRVQQRRAAEAVAMLEPLAANAPDSAEVHYRLGLALMDLPRRDDAARAFTRATALNGDLPEAWLGLSLAALADHRDAEASAALEQVLRLDSSVGWLRARASRALALDRADAAAADARRFVTRHGLADDDGVYTAFIGAIAYRRMGQDGSADALLAEAVPAVDPKSWTARVLSFMQGRIDAKAFMDAAHDNGDRTEAHAYIGFAEIQAGRIPEGKTHLQWIKDKGSRNYTEYGLALGELDRLERLARRN
jgi:tetratricopeptide (TPR) repeat protein